MKIGRSRGENISRETSRSPHKIPLVGGGDGGWGGGLRQLAHRPLGMGGGEGGGEGKLRGLKVKLIDSSLLRVSCREGSPVARLKINIVKIIFSTYDQL